VETTQIEAVTGSIRKYVAIFISALALLNTWPSAALAQTAAGGLFSIENHAGFSDNHVAHVTSELETGIRALKALGVPLRTEKFPITVHLKRGRGISRSYHGRGPIVLHRVAGRRSPIIHELTHMLAGYTWSHGHWTTEGFASYMQDKYGKLGPSHAGSHAGPATEELLWEGKSLAPFSGLRPVVFVLQISDRHARHHKIPRDLRQTI
jgi:hypothetical protein